MRLSPHDHAAIVRATTEVAGDDARVWLFGSRTRDDLRGGDIDLLVELPRRCEAPVRLAGQLSARIERAIGLRKIDILIADPTSVETPVLEAARRSAVAL